MSRLFAVVCLLAAPVLGFLPAPAPRFLRSAPTCSYELEGRPIAGPLEPLSNFLLVKIKTAKAQTMGGIVLPDQAKEKPTEGEVISAGPGMTHLETGVQIPMPVTVGQSVLYGKYDGSKVQYQAEEHMLIRDTDLLLVYDGDEMTIDSVKPAWDRVLVKLEQSAEETSSGIVLAAATAASSKPTEGRVAAVGDGRVATNGERTPMPLAVGDMVKFREYASTEVRIGGEEYVVVQAIDCLAKWSEDE